MQHDEVGKTADDKMQHLKEDGERIRQQKKEDEERIRQHEKEMFHPQMEADRIRNDCYSWVRLIRLQRRRCSTMRLGRLPMIRCST